MSDEGGGERKSYHHGNLRAALVDATLELITEKGPTGFTLAEAARHAGVSAAAPYRHFKGREELIEEVALIGFDMFADLLEHAFTKGPTGSPLEAFYRVGRAYLAFARRYPGHYIAMFESGVSIAGNSELTHVSNRAMAVLTRAAEALMEHIPIAKRPPAIMVSHHIWALSHGIVELFARGTPGGRAPFSPDELLESGTGIYLRGLGILKD
ncbi:TetR/AcrR family transcriptional regulator [Abyssibius alkaniclasticus]|uniref:TetR/AcrR family transcriptional regulator n=1 Tax=Abyssibius alkaniclasticus TaxID=2881234 RepID=UPI0023634AB4|nr:TetR/AcrR family transcriptional regulator [Abyssibius alkaniclasticus]UPH70771.1 TetR/AcrR family transcriptional regulator [Abyssibius alkaniclasticus]